MSRKLTIYTEGPSDAEFIGQVLQFHFAAKLIGNHQYEVNDVDVQIVFEKEGDGQTGGVGQYIARKTKSGAQLDIIETSQRADEDFLLVLDADNNRDANVRAIEKAFRDKNLPKLSKEVSERLYTWPNNEKSGDLEDLLKEIATEVKVFDCWDQFVTCLGEDGKLKLHLPDRKKMIFTYCDLVGKNHKIGQRDFKNTDHWNLDHPWVNTLVEFLKQRLT